MKKIALLVTCEHAVNAVPDAYSMLFDGHEALLQTHRGFDNGALFLATQLQTTLCCPLIAANATRLLIDCNRSLRHPHCFSEITALLSGVEKEQIIANYYQPYRELVINQIASFINAGFIVWHLSIHSFTPVLDGLMRNADIAFLYDPKRIIEKLLARDWQHTLKQSSDFKIRLNYPYRGNSDGFTTALRRQFSEYKYLGFEIEINQALAGCQEKLELIAELLHKSIKRNPY